MSNVKACQKIYRDVIYVGPNATRADGLKYHQSTVEICAVNLNEEGARAGLSGSVNGACKSHFGIMVRECKPVSKVTITVEKPSLFQRAWVALRDYFTKF